MKKNQKGFTLIELMIVVAIIGILAAIALPKFADMLEKSREGATKGNLTAIRSAMNMYTADQAGAWPVIMTDIHTAGGTDVNFLKKYIDKVPAVKATAKNDVNGANAGQGPGQGSLNIDIPFQSTWGVAAGASNFLPAGRGWRYDSLEGKIWVNSNLLDMSNQLFTVYGYQ